MSVKIMSKAKKFKVSDLQRKNFLLQKGIDLSINDKLSYAVKKNIKAINEALEPLIEKFNEEVEDLNIKYAHTDDRGVLVLDNDKYSFDKDNYIKLTKAKRKLQKEFQDKDAEYTPFFTSEPEAERWVELDETLRDELTDILIEVK